MAIGSRLLDLEEMGGCRGEGYSPSPVLLHMAVDDRSHSDVTYVFMFSSLQEGFIFHSMSPNWARRTLYAFREGSLKGAFRDLMHSNDLLCH